MVIISRGHKLSRFTRQPTQTMLPASRLHYRNMSVNYVKTTTHVVVDIVKEWDNGDYQCNVSNRSDGVILGSDTHRISVTGLFTSFLIPPLYLLYMVKLMNLILKNTAGVSMYIKTSSQYPGIYFPRNSFVTDETPILIEGNSRYRILCYSSGAGQVSGYYRNGTKPLFSVHSYSSYYTTFYSTRGRFNQLTKKFLGILRQMKNSTVKEIRRQHGLECLSIQVNKHSEYICNSDSEMHISCIVLGFQIIFAKYLSIYYIFVHAKYIFFLTFTVDTTSLSSNEILLITKLTQHSITLSWTSVSGSSGYYISYERLDFSVPVTPTYMRLGGSDNTSVTLNKLTAGTRYMIRVWATDGSGVSQPIEKTVKTADDSELNIKLYGHIDLNLSIQFLVLHVY